ncbi:hypothetical protein BDB00DRAFT_927113 [Zychaea mexicana]|uniref:uncharacterized protein n=1 Tax=Zychaea mexicana TaxID=64656 RepID=UPI0022FF1027|nr:uncharacterized protein BDB00DRAFT_927113 [Zychaea mexicana]KAI9496068.1 hypothetical protein BDB00DRAFT_927113 [Zychaea mexicana]
MEVKSGSKLRRSGRSKNRTANPMAVYDYALRCALRAYLEQSGNNNSAALNASKKDRGDNRHSIHMGVSGVLGSLTDKFGDDEKKSDKLTREIVRGLLKRLDEVKKSKDLSKMDREEKIFLAIISQFQSKLQQQRYRPTGTVNDLVITFLKTAEAELRKSDPNPAIWYEELNRHIARFAEIVKQTVQEDAPSSATPELMEKLNHFITPTKRRQSDRKQPAPPSPNSPQPADGSIEALESFPMISLIQNMFQVSDADHRKKLKELRAVCTDSAILMDLKKCINNVHTNQSFPGRREDFPSQQAYDNWHRREVKQLTELMNTMMLMKPNLALNSASETDMGFSNLLASEGARSRNSLQQGETDSQNTFAFIPNDPRSYFRLLMSMCIDYDNEVVPDCERAKTSVLSQQSDELLRECWRTWRLSSPFRAVLYLELVRTRFDQNKLDLEDVKDASRALDKVIKENDSSSWAINDRESLIRAYEGLNHTLLHELEAALSEYWKIRPSWVYDLVGMLDKIYENPAYLEDHADPMLAFSRLEETVEGAAVSRWRTLEKAILDDTQDSLTNLLTLADKLIKELVSISKKKFSTPIKGYLEVPGIVMARHMPFFALEMENWAYSPEARNAPVEVTFELYHKVLSLKRLYDQYGPRQKAALFKVESWFLQHVRRWLKTTHAATPEWVENAIKQDEFKPINETAVHSSSIVDLFSMFHQAVDFVQNLQWPNELQRCRFLTALSKVIAIALDQYTNTIEHFILEEVSPPQELEADPSSTGSFLDKARYLTGSHNTVKEEAMPPDFNPELCVMINDIEAARSRLDRLYQIMDVDEIADRMREFGSPAVEKTEQTNFLYSIRVVRAENLQALDNNGLSDPYVVLEISKREVAKTRTVYKTLNPRWDQTFDIWLNERDADALAVVYDEDMIGANQECGSVWFKLSPSYFDDYQMHDLNLTLHPQGKLHLRVSLVGEKDDIQFWFVKAFRTLKRSENDAAALIVDQMGRFMRYCLSRRTLDKLMRKDKSFFSSFSRSNKQVEPSLQECEDAIAPLLDYLEKNLKILNDNLSETNMQLVVLKIWKEVLLTLEGVLRTPKTENNHQQDASLDEYEEHIVLKWLELLKVFFNGGEDGDAVPLDKLENKHYRSLIQDVRHHRDSAPIEGY